MKTIFKTLMLVSALCAIAVPAMAEVVVVVGAKNPTGAMTADQVAQIFLGRSTAMTPVDQAEGSAVRAEFYHKVADKDPSQAKALWSKLVFTGKATPPKEFSSSADIKKALASDAKAIGYMEKSAVDATVKVVFTAP